MIRKDEEPTRAKCSVDSPWVKIAGTVSQSGYICPEYIVEKWNFWKRKHKLTVRQESRPTRDSGIEMTKVIPSETYGAWG